MRRVMVFLAVMALAATTVRTRAEPNTPSFAIQASAQGAQPTVNSLLATVQANASATANARIAATESAATMAAAGPTLTANAQATEVRAATTAYPQLAATATAAAASGEQTVTALSNQVTELEGALVLLATSEAEAQQGQATVEALVGEAETELESLAASATANVPPTPAATAIPTPTAEPEGLLYAADWSEDLNGWAGSPDWKVVDGELVSDGTNPDFNLSIVAPFEPDENESFAIEAEIRVFSMQGCSSFGIVAKHINGVGYRAGAEDQCSSPKRYIARGSSGVLDEAPTTSREITGSWHLYRLEVDGDQLRLYVDGELICEATDNQLSAGRTIGLWSDSATIRVRRFAVIEL